MKNLVFHFFPRMPNQLRFLIFIALFGLGIYIQIITNSIWYGAICIACASLILLNKGVDSRLYIERFHHNAKWQTASRQQIQDIINMQKKLRRWDRSSFEISSCLGKLIFFIIIFISIILFAISEGLNDLSIGIFTCDLLILFVPHFLSGYKHYDTNTKLLLYAKKCLSIADMIANLYPKVNVGFMTLLVERNKDKSVYPKEIKLKLTMGNSPTAFLGCYGQLSINEIGATSYPYFYTVLIFKPEFDLAEKHTKITLTNKNILKEFSVNEGVEVLVLRQVTTRTSGYHTDDKAIRGILAQTFAVYQQLLEV
ncbi:MAG: hypothetical protein GX259_09800 [Bacteroidales bacterium]|nr:hypothetical protein [Bacteroidales bacterium]